MKRILITGMSGTGKSSVIEELNRRGYVAIDTDSEEWCEWNSVIPAETPDEKASRADWVWREDRIQALLRQKHPTHLFVSGCKSNQGKFYPQFDHVALLFAPTDVILSRVAARQNNPYGKRAEEREQILRYIETVEPLLRSRCDREIDTARLDVQHVADALVRLGDEGSSR